MKWVIAVLCLTSVSGLIGGITNVQRWSSSQGVTHYASVLERVLVLAIGLLCAIAAYACVKRKKLGWWLVSVFSVGLIAITAWGIFRVAVHDPFLAFWWLIQIGLMFLFLRWWRRQTTLFSTHEK